MKVFSSLSAFALICGMSMAQVLKYSPPTQPAVSYSIVAAHPNATGGESDLFIQIQGPASMSWIALGQGGSMKGSQMFVIYANSLGDNVTLSPRLSSGYTQPSPDTQSNVTLLAGSGIASSNMTANILCQNCNTWMGGSMDLTGPDQPWIWACKDGDPIRSNSTSVHIQKHDDGAYASFTLNMNTLSPSKSSNPFMDPMDTEVTASQVGGSGGSEADYNGVGIPIHGVIMCLLFIIGYPLGAFMIRLFSFRGLVWVHAAVQTVSYLAAIIGLGVGVYIANKGAASMSSAHTVLGILIVVLLTFQPILGYVHHLQYNRYETATLYTHIHVWLGRVLVTVGMINGLLGLILARQSSGFIVAYCVIVGAIWVLWIVFVFSAARKREMAAKAMVQKKSIRRVVPPAVEYECGERYGGGLYGGRI